MKLEKLTQEELRVIQNDRDNGMPIVEIPEAYRKKESEQAQAIDRYGFKWYGNGEYAYERFERMADGDYVDIK